MDERHSQQELRPIQWQEKQELRLLDQRALPASEEYLYLSTAAETAEAIQLMVVRGAPAIGITAAYGVVLSFKHRVGDSAKVEQDLLLIEQSRPTAVNLHHALAHMRSILKKAHEQKLTYDEIIARLLEQARHIHQQDLAFNLSMAQHGLGILKAEAGSDLTVMTHCNTGSLATGGLGTALGIIKQGAKSGMINKIYATETRPWLQGSRLTAFELLHEGIDVCLLVEGAAASLMATGQIQWLIVGADRITRNGDVANKVGTFTLATLARQFGVKVMVAAPTTTIDMELQSGQDIPIEYRGGEELLMAAGYTDGQAVPVYNPVFDITPAALIDVIVTENGAFKPSELWAI